LWNELEEELKNRTRFFPKSEFIDIFRKCGEESGYTLKKGVTLFRARKIDLKDFSKEVQDIINVVIAQYEDYDYQKSAEKDKDVFEYIQNLQFNEWEDDYINKHYFPNINFWGFNKCGSDAPRNLRTTQGRANPPGIAYLYAARNLDTAISEIQPNIGQIVSVAQIKTLRKLNLFDFNMYNNMSNSKLLRLSVDEIKKKLDFSSFWEIETFFNTISELYSRPAFGNTENYYVTQYLSEILKDLGFDGIKYKSSLIKRGTNIVLFDISKDEANNPKNYEILCSSIHRIYNVKIMSKIILPKERPIKLREKAE